MKAISYIIILSTLLITFSLNAQDYNKHKIEKALNYKVIYDNIDSNEQSFIPYSKDGGVPIGSSQNIYSILLSGPHQVMYNSEINTLVFVHRALDAGGHDSGELAFDFSTDGGDTWTTEAWISQNAQTDDAECRYPSITIYNPEGNTDPANARIIANGPSVIGYGFSYGWGYSFEIDATIEANPTTNEFYGSNNGDDTDILPNSITMGANGTAWSISAGYNGSDYTDNIYVNKAVYNSNTDKFDWSSPHFTISPDFFYDDDYKYLNDWDIAVHPTDPDIIYAVINCMEIGDTREVPSPHVWKTINGGDDWTALPPIDYTVEPLATELEAYIQNVEGYPMMPYIFETDVTVDANGTLHIFSDVWSKHYDYGYPPPWGLASYRHYMDFTTTDGTDWAMQYINDVECVAAPWDDVKTYTHPQISRNESGTDIFYTWSETYADPDSLNTAPNMMAAHWNTTDGLKNDSINLTDGTGAQGICYFPQVSPVVIDNSNGTFELPMVIALIDFAGGSPDDQVNYIYLIDFLPPPPGVNKIGKPDIIIYPNPVADKVFVSVGAKVEMYNILGAKLLSVEERSDVTTIEMSKYPAGTYLLKIYTDERIVTKKIQKVKK